MAWVAEDTFDSYSDGDLHGNNGGTGWAGAWNADGAYDVEGTTVYQGAKAVTGVNANANASRTLSSSTDSGVIYFALRMSTHGAGTGDAAFDLRTNGGADNRIRTQFRGDSGNVTISDGGGVATIITGFDAGTFYLFEVTFDAGNNHSVRYHNGVNWSVSAGPYAAANNGSIDTVIFNGGSNQTMFYDYISPTNPIQTKPFRTLLGVGS